MLTMDLTQTVRVCSLCGLLLAVGCVTTANPPAPPGAAELSFDFEEPAADSFEIGPLARIEGDPVGLINGAGTLVGDSRRSDTEWNILFQSAPGLLKPEGRYRIRFQYKVFDRDPKDGYFYGLFQSAKEAAERPWASKAYSTWKGSPLTVGEHIQNVTLGPYDDYRLVLGVHGKGAIGVDDITLERLESYPQPEPDSSVAAPANRVVYEPYGMCFQAGMPWVYSTEEEIREAVRLMADAGVQWVRLGPGWMFMEPERGQIDSVYLRKIDIAVDEALRAGMDLYMQLLGTPVWASTNPQAENSWAFPPKDLEAWRDHVRFLVKRYGDRIRYWEVWNEWDWEFWESSVTDYAALLGAAHGVLKKHAPDCKVILGGLATDGIHTWDSPRAVTHALQKLYDAGGGPFFDILAIHPYAWDEYTGITESIDKVNTAISVMRANGDGSKRIWITEIGVDTVSVSDERQAAYLRQVYDVLTRHPQVDKVFWYNFRCIGADPSDQQSNFGIVDFDFGPRPAYEAYRAMPKPSTRCVVNDLLEPVLVATPPAMERQ